MRSLSHPKHASVTGMPSTNQPVPVLRRVAAALVGLQALVATVNGILIIVRDGFLAESSSQVAFAFAALALLLAVVLAFASQAFWVGKTWPRGLVMTWQVLLAAVMVATLVDVWSWWQVGNLVVALACGAAVVMDMRRERSSALSSHIEA